MFDSSPIYDVLMSCTRSSYTPGIRRNYPEQVKMAGNLVWNARYHCACMVGYRCPTSCTLICAFACMSMNIRSTFYLSSQVLLYLSHGMTKPTTWPVHPAKTLPSLISLRCALNGYLRVPSFRHADREDSDHTGRIPRPIRVFAGCTGHFVVFFNSPEPLGSLVSL